jgi:hypothetical protein
MARAAAKRATTRPPSRNVSAAQLLEAWPLTVPLGTLRLERGHAVVFRAPDGTDYAVNGMATTWGLGAPIEAIWAAGQVSGARRDLGPLVALGLALGEGR